MNKLCYLLHRFLEEMNEHHSRHLLAVLSYEHCTSDSVWSAKSLLVTTSSKVKNIQTHSFKIVIYTCICIDKCCTLVHLNDVH